jgi:TonB family protein
VKLFATRVADYPDRKALSAALSLIGHALLLALLLALPKAALDLTGGTGGIFGPFDEPGGGGGGAETVQYISVAREASARAEEPPVPEVKAQPEELVQPMPEPEAVVMEDSLPVDAAAATGADTLTASALSGAGAGAGVGPGTDAGSGGGIGGGAGTGIGTGTGLGSGGGGSIGRPPSPRMLLLPPTAPREMRGRSVAVQLAVDSAGVVRDVTLIPETGDDDFDAAIRRTALAWRFHPGTDASGRSVAQSFEVVLSF